MLELKNELFTGLICKNKTVLIMSFLVVISDSETGHRCSVVELIFNSMDKCKAPGVET